MRLLLSLFCLVFSVRAEPKEDLITDPLPGFNGNFAFRHFAGYLNVSDTKRLFYWYVESQGDPSKDPVSLWLNGGPGCSSLQGMLQEHGPFRVSNYGNGFAQNPLTWQRYSNFIYLDAPAGVGLSYRTDGVNKYTDDEVAEDNRMALIKFFEKFPERKTNDLYLFGESYAGTYIPTLAARLVKDPQNFPQFKGMSIGNGCINNKLLFNSGIQWSYNHALIDETQWEATIKKCCKGSASYDCDFHARHNHADECYEDELGESENDKLRDAPDPSAPQCAHPDDFEQWLQRDDVRKVLRIPAVVPKYESCSDAIEEHYHSTYTDMSDTVRTVIDAGKKVMFFNGDVDSVCNVMHNEQFLAQLNYPLKMSKTAWKDVGQKPATVGYWTAYQGVEFLTIRGAGHFTSADNEKPRESLQMFYNFINGRNYTYPVPTPVIPTSTPTPNTSSSTVAPATQSTQKP